MFKKYTLIQVLSFQIILAFLSYSGVSHSAGFETTIDARRAEINTEQNEKLNKLKVLLGKVFFAYFPRASCLNSISDRPSLFTQTKYKSDTPVAVGFEALVYDETKLLYFRLKMQDGSIGYIPDHMADRLIANPTSENELRRKCFIEYVPTVLNDKLDRFELDRQKKIDEIAEEKKAGEELARNKADAEREVNAAAEIELQRNAPATLKNMSVETLCVNSGKAIRGEYLYELGNSSNNLNYVQLELRRRKILLNESTVKAQVIRTGITVCQLFAAWGLPREQNRSVGSWGVHIQHIYGGGYVYTENGRVTSWQD